MVRFEWHCEAYLTACKVKRNTYTCTQSYIFHVTRVRYGSEFLSQLTLDAPFLLVC
jgi:hypothetical protein